METTGDCRIRGKHVGTSNNVYRKLDLMILELKRYGLSAAAIQETKWFGNDIWQSNDYTFFHSRRPMPDHGDIAVQNEGVELALDKEATKA